MTKRIERLNYASMGVILVLVSAVSFGAMPIFARFAYAAGVDTHTLLTVRFWVGTLILVPGVWVLRIPWPKGRYLAGAIVLGSIGFFLEALAFFYALTMASTGIVTLSLYLYPSVVAMISVLFFKERLSGIQRVAIVLALLGMSMIVTLSGRNTAMGIVLGVASALIYAVYVIGCSRVTTGAHPLSTSAVIIASAAMSFSLLALYKGFHWPAGLYRIQGWCALVALGTISTVLAIGCFVVGAHKIGSTQASVFASVEPVITLLLAYWILEESMTLKQVIGASLVLASTALLALRRHGQYPRQQSPTFTRYRLDRMHGG